MIYYLTLYTAKKDPVGSTAAESEGLHEPVTRTVRQRGWSLLEFGRAKRPKSLDALQLTDSSFNVQYSHVDACGGGWLVILVCAVVMMDA